MHRACVIVLAVVAASVPLTPSEAACKPARFQIMGNLVDRAERPVVDAIVRVLLDRVSEQEFAKQGPRARLVRTNNSGAYVVMIDCDEASKAGDAPNPCADKPKYVTLIVEAAGYRSKVVVHKIKDLELIKDPGGCLILVPDVRLAPG
jgi:hypothetical protein